MSDVESSEELFAQWLDSAERGEPVEFESFVAEHPELADELRALHGMWGRFESIASELTGVPTGADAAPPDHPRYRVERRLAGGGMGVIYEVLDAQLGRSLAMKVLRESRDPGTAKRRRSRFVDEARVVGQLEHPGIVPIHELGEDAAGNAWFTMRLVQGRTFSEILAAVAAGDPDWSLARALGVLRRVCDTMAYAHSRDVLHRDLKPANVMVGPFGETYVMDWGLARIGAEPEAGGGGEPGDEADLGTGMRTLDGDVLGTPAYMSPEQARGDLAAVGRGTDVYAVGAMLYHLCAGAPPYAEEQSAAGMLAALRSGPPRPPQSGSAPQELIAIAARAMERDPARRYRDMHELSADLDAYLEGRVVGAFEHGPWARARKWIARNRTLASSLGAATVLGLIAVFAFVRTAVVREAEQAVTQRFQDLELLDDLRAEARLLWPALPERASALAAWLERVDTIAGRLPGHRAAAEEADEGTWIAGKYAQLVAEVEAFVDREPSEGDRADVAERLERARRIARLAASPAAEAAWARSAERSPGIARADDLFPLGPEAVSGRSVFEHVPSASFDRLEELASGAVTGPSERLAPGDGLQLIQTEAAPAGQLLIARQELTQGQWARVAAGGRVGVELLPRADLSWLEAAVVAWRLGLCLPSVAELMAGFGDSEGPGFWWGESLGDARDFELLNWATQETVPLEPAGSRRPNPRGLYDTYGSLTEWVRDAWLDDDHNSYAASRPVLRGLDELALEAAWAPRRVSFGAHYLFRPEDLAAIFPSQVPLFQADASERHAYRGLRPVRPR